MRSIVSEFYSRLPASALGMYSKIPIPVRDALRRGMMMLLDARMKKFYSQFAGPGKLVIDVGANIGDYTKIYRDLGADVISIEPQPECVELLRKKFENDKKTIILPVGIGTKSGTKKLFVSTLNNPVSSFSQEFIRDSRYNGRKWDKTISVKMTTLDKIIKKYGRPDFCKIDVEGFEWEVISSLKKPIPGLSFEFLSEFSHKTEKIIRYLDRLGMKEFNLSLLMNYKFHLDGWVSGKKLVEILKDNRGDDWCGDIYVRMAEK